MNTTVGNDSNSRLTPLEQLLQCSSTIIVDNPKSHSTIASCPCHFSSCHSQKVSAVEPSESRKQQSFDRWTPVECSPMGASKVKLGRELFTAMQSSAPSLFDLCRPRRRSSWPARDFDRWSPAEESSEPLFQSHAIPTTTVDDTNARLPRRQPSLCADDNNTCPVSILSRVNWAEIQALF
mmetsp:Transcript_12324/g.23560  ORF Transcript_12324/g.23560 Transcript_12324/m.23560 type:complete len:180 (+) Transcript_12324:148-687(+)|eukprot:scaffold3189_cov166-Amphora_coffeaeformis.AAC.6